MLKTCRNCGAEPAYCSANAPEIDYPCWIPPETPLLVDVLAKLIRETRQLAMSEGWKAPPPWWREIDAALIRHQQGS